MPDALLLGLALAACGSCGGDKSPAGDGVPDTSGTGDTADTSGDGAGDASGDTGADGALSGLCRDDSECTGAGEVCDCHGQCVVATGTACTEDRNCGVPRWCNGCTGHCEEQAGVCEPCSDSRGCLDLGACLPYASGGTFCGLGCVTDVGCPEGFACLPVEGVSQKQCIAKSGTCEDLGLCAGDGDCPVGQICSEVTRTCANGCSEDGQCQQGTVCVGARCVPPCSGDGECTAPATCQGGKCKIPGACEAPSDCPAPATYCSRETGQCAPGCQVDADCKDAAKVCKDGACADKGCQHNFECAYAQVCDKPSGQCVPMPTDVPYCAACDAEAQANPSCPDPNACVRYQDANGQTMGDYCIVPCMDDPIDRCPSGWQCEKVADPQGGADRFFCARMCYIDPVGAAP